MMKKHLARAATVGLTLGVLLAGAAACGNSPTTSAKPTTSNTATQTTTTVSPHQGKTIDVTMKIVSGPGKLNGQEQPYFTNTSWKVTSGGTISAGDTVNLTIISNDDGPAAPPPGFNTVKGTVGGTETVNGKSVASVATKDISHTFSIPALGINLPIPVAPTGGTVTVSATIKMAKTGTFDWQCFAPCGSGASGWGGAMATADWMKGTVTISQG